MNLTAQLAARVEAGRPVRVGLIGAGKFGSMFLAQVPTIPGLEVATIADLDPDRARAACRVVGWDETRVQRTRFIESGLELCADEAVEVVVYPRRRTFYEALSDSFGRSGAGVNVVRALTGAHGPGRAIASATAPGRLFRRGEPLALMPFAFVR